ncbi:MAG: zf-HC2 domain-containing protein [Bacteroidales bacterium]|nr:zf-HC2 domain-containing protein [Candidatus Latescibacterota bacterium]
MKDCNKIKPMLSEYIDDVLPEADSARVRSHLEECTECMEMHRSMREIIVHMNDMEQVDPPPGFADRVNERLEQESPLRRVIRGIFHPLHIKVPIEIAGLAAAVVLIVYISGFVGKQGVEDALPVGTGMEKAERLDGVRYVEEGKARGVGRIPEEREEKDMEDLDVPSGSEVVYESTTLPKVESTTPSITESPTTSALNESEKKKTTAGITSQAASDKSDGSESESVESQSTPKFAGTTQEILVEAKVKQIEVRDSDVSYKVTSDELEEKPADDVVEALALKGGIVRTGDDLHARSGFASTDLPNIDSSPDSIMAHLSWTVDLLGGRIIDEMIVDEKEIDHFDTDADAIRVRTTRSLAARESSAVESSARPDSLVGLRMSPVVVIVPRSELERLYMAILRIGSVRPVEMEQIAEEGDSVRLRIEFP